MNKIFNRIFFWLIAVLWMGYVILNMASPEKTFLETENRLPAKFPEFTLETLINGQYMPKLESYLNDQFVGRANWITVKTAAEKLMGKTDSGGVYFGKDGYLIEKHEPDQNQTQTNVESIKNMLESLKDKYNTQVLIAPTASLILNDKLPPFAPVWNQSELIDKVAALGNFVDVRDTLYEHKDEYIYYRTDHHWTSLGAYYAYVQLCNALGIQPLSIESELVKETLSDEFMGTLAAKVNQSGNPDILDTYHTSLGLKVNYNQGQIITDTLYEKEYLDQRSKYSVFLNENQPYVEITTDNKNGKTLVMVKDSYAHCMVPMLVNHYERVVLLDFRSLNMGFVSQAIPMIEEGGKIDDIVVLYNAENFTNERTVYMLAK